MFNLLTAHSNSKSAFDIFLNQVNSLCLSHSDYKIWIAFFFWVVLILGHHNTLIFFSFLQNKLNTSDLISYSERIFCLVQLKRCFRNVTKGKIWKVWNFVGDAMGINLALLSMVGYINRSILASVSNHTQINRTGN